MRVGPPSLQAVLPLVAFLLTSASSRSAIHLEPLKVFHEGEGSNNPREVAAGDFDGDGKQDVVVVGMASDNISLFLGDGTGGLRRARSFVVGRGPTSIAAGDVDGDGGRDIVVGLWDGHAVVVMRNDGQGVFVRVATYSVSPNPATVALGDLDGDGRLDLVVGCYQDRSVQVLRGNGDGTFGSRNALTGSVVANNVVVADLDGDSNLDIVASDLTSAPAAYRVPVWFGRGDGTFEDPEWVTTYSRTSWVQAADFNRDGLVDLILAGPFGGLVYAGRGLGSRKFRVGQIPPRCESSGTGIVVADMNGDGQMDIWTPRGIYVGTGGFGVRQEGGGGGANGAAVDLDADGRKDVVAVSSSQDAAFVSSLGKPPRRVPTGDGLASVTSGDLTRDGRPELVIWERGELRVRVLSRAGTGWQAIHEARPGDFSGSPLLAGVFVAEVTGDEWPDVVVLGWPTLLFANDAGRGLMPGARVDVPGDPGMCLIDIDRDGLVDLVSSLRWQRALGGTSFGAPLPVVTGLSGVTSSGFADVNGDSLEDVVVVRSHTAVSWYPARPTGGFDGEVTGGTVPTGADYGPLRAIDLDGDGADELVFSSTEHPTRAVFPLAGWAVRSSLPADYRFPPSSVDADGDGRNDLLFAENSYPTRLWLWHPEAESETATLDCIPLSGPGLGIDSTTRLDVDGDGRDDLVMSLQGTAKLAYLRSSPVPVPPGDLDASGVTDVLDLVLEAGYIVGNVRADEGAFRRSEPAADLDGNAVADVQDLVLMANLIAGNICP